MMGQHTEQDDRILRETRVLGAFIVPFLLAAFLGLYLFPGDTGRWFAWEIHPAMTPLLMGAGYIAGSYFFARVILERRWHHVHVGFLPITAFTAFMAIATFTHLDRFTHGHPTFWVWIVLYIITPVLVPLAWVRNRRTDPGALEPGEAPLHARVRWILVGAGAVQSAIALLLLVSPSTMIDAWPWRLTPLTAQVIGGWFALPGVTALMMGLDGRWSAVRITLESQAIGLALILLGVARAWGDFDKSKALTYVFVGGLVLLLAGLCALEASMQAAQRRRFGPPAAR